MYRKTTLPKYRYGSFELNPSMQDQSEYMSQAVCPFREGTNDPRPVLLPSGLLVYSFPDASLPDLRMPSGVSLFGDGGRTIRGVVWSRRNRSKPSEKRHWQSLMTGLNETQATRSVGQ
jgi:hypothetical protein